MARVVPCETAMNSVMLHLMIRHGVNALADSFLDQCEFAAVACTSATRTGAQRVRHLFALPRLHLQRVPDSSHA